MGTLVGMVASPHQGLTFLILIIEVAKLRLVAVRTSRRGSAKSEEEINFHCPRSV